MIGQVHGVDDDDEEESHFERPIVPQHCETSSAGNVVMEMQTFTDQQNAAYAEQQRVQTQQEERQVTPEVLVQNTMYQRHSDEQQVEQQHQQQFAQDPEWVPPPPQASQLRLLMNGSVRQTKF